MLRRGEADDMVDLGWAPDSSCVVAAHQRSGKVTVLETPTTTGNGERASCPLRQLVSSMGREINKLGLVDYYKVHMQ